MTKNFLRQYSGWFDKILLQSAILASNPKSDRRGRAPVAQEHSSREPLTIACVKYADFAL